MSNSLGTQEENYRYERADNGKKNKQKETETVKLQCWALIDIEHWSIPGSNTGQFFLI